MDGSSSQTSQLLAPSQHVDRFHHGGAAVTASMAAGPASDAKLIASVTNRCHVALAEIYVRHGADVRRLAQRLRGRDAADDVVHDVFVRLWERPGSYDPLQGSLRSFLMMQTRGRCIDLIRHDGARRSREAANFAEPRDAQRPIDDVVLARLAGERVWSLLSTLSDGERSAIVLAYFAGHTYGEVARLLDQPEGTVKSRIRLGLAKLRRTIDTAKTPPTPLLSQTLRS